MTSNNLPFELSEDSITNWLQSLSHLGSVNSASQLNNVVKQLESTKQDANKTLEALIQLTPTVLFVCSDIESSLLATTTKKVSEISKKVEKLCIQLLKNLSLNFCFFGVKKTLSVEEKTLAIYLALQLIGYSQRITSIFHHIPSTTLWKKTGELYMLLLRNNTLHDEIKHKIRDFKNQSTIEAVLKRNLLFAILASYQYSSSQIKELFSVSNKHAHLLNLNIENSTNNTFFWGPGSGTIPCIQSETQKTNPFDIPIDTNDFLFLIRSEDFSSALEKETKEHIIARLSRYKDIFDSTSSSTKTINHIVTGFTDITNFLEKIDKLEKIQRLSSEYDNVPPIDKMSLELMESEKDYLSPVSDSTSSSYIDNFLTGIKAINIWPTKNNQYIVAEINTIHCSIDDIVLVSDSVLKPELGIIRQIKCINPPNGAHALIEKIAGTPSSHQIDSSPNASTEQIIIIQTQNSKPEVFIAPCMFHYDTQITSSAEETFTLEKLIDYSPYYMHFLCG